jgi:hypothetical protein
VSLPCWRWAGLIATTCREERHLDVAREWSPRNQPWPSMPYKGEFYFTALRTWGTLCTMSAGSPGSSFEGDFAGGKPAYLTTGTGAAALPKSCMSRIPDRKSGTACSRGGR